MSIEKWKAEVMSRCKAKWSEGDAAWLRGRGGLMTATKAAAALGLSNFTSPMDVYNEWRDPEYRSSRTPSDELRMAIGISAEEHIRKYAAGHSERPGHYEQFHCEARLVGHPEHEWAACSPDGFAMSGSLGRIVLEIKNTNMGTKHMYETDDGQPCCPPAYRAQVVWNMACTGADCGVLIANFNGNLIFRLIERDVEEIEFLFAEARKFVDACEDDNPVSIFSIIQDGNMRWAAVKELYRQATDDGISVMDSELDAHIQTYLEVDKKLKETTERHKWLKSMVGEKIGGHRKVETGRYKVSWPQNSGKLRFDLELFRRKNPTVNIEDYYTRSKPFRMGMRISPIKESK